MHQQMSCLFRLQGSVQGCKVASKNQRYSRRRPPSLFVLSEYGRYTQIAIQQSGSGLRAQGVLGQYIQLYCIIYLMVWQGWQVNIFNKFNGVPIQKHRTRALSERMRENQPPAWTWAWPTLKIDSAQNRPRQQYRALALQSTWCLRHRKGHQAYIFNPYRINIGYTQQYAMLAPHYCSALPCFYLPLYFILFISEQMSLSVQFTFGSVQVDGHNHLQSTWRVFFVRRTSHIGRVL